MPPGEAENASPQGGRKCFPPGCLRFYSWQPSDHIWTEPDMIAYGGYFIGYHTQARDLEIRLAQTLGSSLPAQTLGFLPAVCADSGVQPKAGSRGLSAGSRRLIFYHAQALGISVHICPRVDCEPGGENTLRTNRRRRIGIRGMLGSSATSSPR